LGGRTGLIDYFGEIVFQVTLKEAIGKCLLYIGPIGNNADISRMVYELKLFIHLQMNYIIYCSEGKL